MESESEPFEDSEYDTPSRNQQSDVPTHSIPDSMSLHSETPVLSSCNDPTIGSYNHYHLSPNGIPRGNQRWYGLVYFIQIAGKPRMRPRE